MKTSLAVVCVGIVLTTCPLAQANFYGADNFNDNSKDTSLWGDDVGCPEAVLTETSGAVYLTGTAPVEEDYWRARPWISNVGSQTEDWTARIEVNIPNLTLGTSHSATLGMDIMNSGDTDDSADIHLRYSENYGSGRDFVGAVDVNGTPDPSPVLAATSSTNAAVQFRWDASDTTLYMEYDSDGAANGFSWTLLRSDDLASGATDWDMGASDTFQLAIYGDLEALDGATEPFTIIQGDEVKMDNFSLTPEPSALTLAALGVLGLGFFLWRHASHRRRAGTSSGVD